jgi:2-polyprenyl-3-methyl-5-hydroxy-6-metoxy-1,4-benzoquinol methylase
LISTTDNWDEHWGTQATANALNPAQGYRIRLVLEALALRGAKAPVRLLDLGSGSGEFAATVLRESPGIEVVGLDLSAVGVELAQQKVPEARFFQQDFTRGLNLDGRYHQWATHAVCSEVLEHLDDPVAMLRNVRPLFAPGCRVVVTVPAGPMSAFDLRIGHRRHYTAQLLEETLRNAGLGVPELCGAGFPFFNLYRLAVVARGEKLVSDLAGRDVTTLPLSARATIRVFSWLFKLNAKSTKYGWQLLAIGEEPR